jgi:hypothetical protein
MLGFKKFRKNLENCIISKRSGCNPSSKEKGKSLLVIEPIKGETPSRRKAQGNAHLRTK